MHRESFFSQKRKDKEKNQHTHLSDTPPLVRLEILLGPVSFDGGVGPGAGQGQVDGLVKDLKALNLFYSALGGGWVVKDDKGLALGLEVGLGNNVDDVAVLGKDCRQRLLEHVGFDALLEVADIDTTRIIAVPGFWFLRVSFFFVGLSLGNSKKKKKKKTKFYSSTPSFVYQIPDAVSECNDTYVAIGASDMVERIFLRLMKNNRLIEGRFPVLCSLRLLFAVDNEIRCRRVFRRERVMTQQRSYMPHQLLTLIPPLTPIQPKTWTNRSQKKCGYRVRWLCSMELIKCT